MKRTIFGLCLAFALAGCGQDGGNTNDASTMGPKDRESAASGASSSPSGAGNSQSGVQPSGAPQPGQNPTQQQIDPKQPEQHRDFRHPNEGAAPQNPYGN